MKKQKGFTIMELLVVLTLVAFIGAMMLPNLQKLWNGMQIHYAAKQLQQDLRWAQELADKDGQRVTITFFQNMEPCRYVVREYGNLEYYRTGTLPKQLDKKTLQTITINPDKSFQKNGHLFLQKGDVKRYVYYYQTGRTRISSQYTSG